MSQKNGFSLVELMIVVAIVSIVAAILVPRFLNHQQELRKSRPAETVKKQTGNE